MLYLLHEMYGFLKFIYMEYLFFLFATLCTFHKFKLPHGCLFMLCS